MKRANAFTTGLFVAASLVACDKDPVGPPDSVQQDIPISGAAVVGMEPYDQRIRDLMRKYAIPGGAIAVVRDGKLFYARGFGYADVEKQTPV